jgi:hypothetical protein
MEHPRKALQGLNDNFIHGHVSGLASLAFSNSKPLLFQVNVAPSEIEHFAFSGTYD